MQENKFFRERFLHIIITILAFIAISMMASKCWKVDMWKIYRVLYMLYLPFLPIVISIITKRPSRAYGGLISFFITFLYLNYPSCSVNHGGASMIQIPIIYIGTLASIGGIFLTELLITSFSNISSEIKSRKSH